MRKFPLGCLLLNLYYVAFNFTPTIAVRLGMNAFVIKLAFGEHGNALLLLSKLNLMFKENIINGLSVKFINNLRENKLN